MTGGQGCAECGGDTGRSPRHLGLSAATGTRRNGPLGTGTLRAGRAVLPREGENLSGVQRPALGAGGLLDL